MVETTANTGHEPIGNTVEDAARAFESLLTPQEQPAAEENAAEAQASEDDAEPDADSDAADAEPEAEGTEENPEASLTYSVKLPDGTKAEVTVEDLTRGYLRNSDYTRKTQELAESRQAFQREISEVAQATHAENQQLRQERALYAQLLPALQHALVAQSQEPDWDRLYSDDPIEAVRQEREFRKKGDILRSAQAEQQRIGQLQYAEQQQALQEQLTQAAAQLVELVPEWQDEAKASVEKRSLMDYGKKVGFSKEELATIVDARAVVLLRKAYMFDQINQKKQTLRPDAPVVRTATPGAKRQATSEITRSKQRLAQTGHIKDAAALFEQML